MVAGAWPDQMPLNLKSYAKKAVDFLTAFFSD